MYWFKNLMAYRLTSQIDFSKLETALENSRFTPCESTDYSKFGWTAPLHGNESLKFEINGHILIVACKEEKVLPAYAVNRQLAARVAALEEKEGRKLKKTEKLSIKDSVMAEMLPRAFSKFTHTAIWIDTAKGLIFVDSSSAKKSEDVLALLRKSLGSLPVVPLSYNSNPSEVMTSWLVNGTPQWLMLLEEGKLKRFDVDSLAIFKRQDLEGEEVTTCLEHGAMAVSLAVERENHLSFILHEDGTLSRLKFADEVREKNDDILKEDVAQRFDADFLLMTQELSQLIELIAAEFGNIKK
ncbi:recombination-associated protein RdgC [Mannheimia bovis]|uniref:recombination-associated protein RdgC n=1 Tax=Mannheimia bovis TaxID=2770636 RepID=UPI0024B6642D|nr:recombination-associated protein RdgC [Mannheimia bovis]WHP46407.1 recombination-associated protein RdgC [Mannheimia bovis]